MTPRLASEEEAIYAALATPLGLIVRGDAGALQRARARLLGQDDSVRPLAILGPDERGQVWLFRRDKT